MTTQKGENNTEAPVKYMMEWKIKEVTNTYGKAVDNFLKTGARLPVGCKLIGRYHAPGSVKGWLIVETSNVNHIYKHASEWGEFLSWETTPVLLDEAAGMESSNVRSTSVYGCFY
jgi:hypothetical protein